MRTSRIRRRTIAGALALMAASAAACGAEPQTPLPVQGASAQPTAASSGSPATPPSASAGAASSAPTVVRPPGVVKPTRTKTSRPNPTSASACFGAIRYDLDLQNTVPELQKTMCFHTGGVLRLQGIGPGLVESGPASVVSQSYEAGVVDLRFIRPGTATVTIPQDDQTHTITVVVRD